ncbi:MAG: SH3 domain-containing protein [Clostridiales bacterium]|nr:SH3 domain-containing protein [Clostridiales bacterium]
MKRKSIFITGCFAVVLVITLLTNTCDFLHAVTADELNPKEQLQVQDIGWEIAHGGEESAYEYVVKNYGGSLSTNVIQLCIDHGYWKNHVEELKALGYTNVDYSAVTGSSNATTPTQTQPAEPAKTPEPFTVEAYNPAKAMWTTQNVNCREGASTEYNKVGSLKEHEQVNVTGVASTGWYQITKEDGAVVYVSNKYLTEEAPTTQTIYQYDEKDGVVETITVTGENVEDVDRVVAEITATPEPTLEPTPEPTVEPTPVPTPEPTAEPVIEEAVESGINMWYVAGAAFALVVLVIAIVMVARKKK